MTAAHVGNNDADRGGDRRTWACRSTWSPTIPRSRSCSSYLRAQREQWQRDAHPVAQPAGDLRRAAPARGARPAGRLGLPQRRHPGPAVRRLDDAAGRARRRWRPRPSSRILPADHHPPAGRPPSGRPGRADRRRRRTTRPSSSGRPRRSPTPWPTSIRPAPEQWYSFKPIWPATRRRGRRPRATRAGDAGRTARSRARRATCRATRPTRSIGDAEP